MTNTTITCDQCQQSIEPREGMERYYLSLGARCLSPLGNIRYAVHIEPELTRSFDFCSKRCLHDWVEGNVQPITPKI